MASKIKVDQIEGSTADTITIPTGQTFTVTDGIPVASGGTGLASFAAGDILYATGATTLAKLTKGTAEQVLAMNAGATAPDWGSVDLTVLPTITVAKGGTALSSFVAGDILYATGTTTLAKLAKGAATEVLAMNAGATAPEWATAASGVVKKIHTYTFNTRTSSTTSTYNQFTWTAAFVPLDPVNNSMWVQQIVPMWGDGDDAEGFGMRWTKSGGSDYDFMCKGINYTDTNNQGINSNYFNIPAGTIVAGTYTLYFRLDVTGAAHAYYCPNSSNDSRISTQTQAELIITEYKNS